MDKQKSLENNPAYKEFVSSYGAFLPENNQKKTK